ncbi:MAG: NUDIX domain-containing protein [Rubrivivax sp.]|nr:NUDIX domain-containing protein [Rubrivivax sp.]
MSGDKRPPRLAATVVLTRDAPGGMELLLLRRAEKGDHNSGAWVFPGGLVDAADRECHAFCSGLDDAQASRLLGLEAGGLDMFVAAVRECFEEAGVLYATTPDGRGIDLQGASGAALLARRAALATGGCSLADLCQAPGLRLCVDRLHYIAHWLTPVGRAKRFDTRFFVAVLPAGQAPAHDAVETVEQVWLTPAQALAPQNARRLMTPTRAVIEQLAAFADTTALLSWARAPRQVARVLPRLATRADGPCPILPGDPAWDEVGRLDPEGCGLAWCEARPGVPLALAPGVLRLTAAATGGHSYLVECDPGAWALIDPGPPDAAHHDALIAALPGPLRWICLTDGDAGQARGAAALVARTGAQLLRTERSRATAVGTLLGAWPGPAPGSSCYLRAEDGMLFAGTQSLPADWLAAHGVEWLAARNGFLSAAFPAAETAP